MKQKFLIIIGILVVAAFSYFYLYPQLAWTRMEMMRDDSAVEKSVTITVALNKEFSLNIDQTAQVKGLEVSLKIKNFINSPCPKDVECFWSGQAVVYELQVDGKVYESMSSGMNGSPYQVTVIDSDYTTYAKFVIKKSK